MATITKKEHRTERVDKLVGKITGITSGSAINIPVGAREIISILAKTRETTSTATFTINADRTATLAASVTAISKSPAYPTVDFEITYERGGGGLATIAVA